MKFASFEDAVAATGIGKFHYLLFLSIIPVSWATNIDTANISLILTPAECDLELTMTHKSILNVVVYAGLQKVCKRNFINQKITKNIFN